MEILINVIGQSLKILTNFKKIISGTQEFIRFTFNLSDDWKNLVTFVQFVQNGEAYNQYLDDENSVCLPPEIGPGLCTLMLYGVDGTVKATSTYLTFTIDDNILISDATSTEISQSLYEQLISKISTLTNRIERVESGGGSDGRSIVSIEKTSTADLVDTYTITYNDETTSTFEVKNGEKGESFAVTPESFGAVGDGIADDTEAVRACFESDIVKIVASKKYKITEAISFDKPKIVSGGGTFFAPSSDTRYSMFKCESSHQIPFFIVRDVHFESVRDNDNVYPPTGHIRHENSQSSNVSFLELHSVEKVKIDNVSYANAEFDVLLHDCEVVTETYVQSINASMHTYATGNGKMIFEHGYVSLYEYLGAGDHHFYIGHGNGDVFVRDFDLLSGENSGTYAVHAYASNEQSETYGITKRVVVEDCQITCKSAFATVAENFIVRNTTVVCTDEHIFYNEASNSDCRIIFDGLTVKSNADISLRTLSNFVVFKNCSFNKTLFFFGNSTFEFDSCYFYSVSLRTDFMGKLIIKNSVINATSTYAFYSLSGSDVEIVKSELYANADGVVSVRSDATLTMIECIGTNAKDSKFFNYNTTSYLPTINLISCTFADVKIRTTDTTTTFITKGTVFEDTPTIDDIPSKTSQLENDSGFITLADLPIYGGEIE